MSPLGKKNIYKYCNRLGQSRAGVKEKYKNISLELGIGGKNSVSVMQKRQTTARDQK